MRTVPFALLVCVHVPLLACSRDERPAPAAYAVDSGAKALARDSAPDAASSAAPPPHARTDAHDYRGTLGTKTAIALHLDRFATTAVGSYVYTSVGVPIGFSGTLDAAGGLVLTESVQGKSTGTLRLAVSGDDLVGTWTGASASKTFPVRLSPGAPWVATKTVKPGEIWKRAEACLADPTCSADDAARGFVEADDAHETDVDCWAFIDGAGTARDVPRGRACLERDAARESCAGPDGGSGESGGSGGLGLADLAAMRIDGIGGPVDLARAKELFAGCFQDVTAQWVLARANAKHDDPKLAPQSICDAGNGTTLVMNECFARESRAELAHEALMAKTVVAGLDPAGKALFIAATKAFDVYVHAMGTYAYDVFIEGSIRNAMALTRERELHEARAKRLAMFSAFVAPETPAEAVARVRRSSAAALAAVIPDTPAEAEALKKTASTWAPYRDAEVTLYVHAFGAKQGADRVRRAMQVSLETQRSKECGPPSAGHD